MIKKYEIQHYPTYGSITVKIDFDYKSKYGEEVVTMEDSIKGMVNFWTGSEQRIEENDGNILNAFLKSLCQKSISILADTNLSTYGLVHEFDDLEGWCKMDGSSGIEIIDCDEPYLSDQDEYGITEK